MLHVQLNIIYRGTKLEHIFLPLVTIFLLPVTTFPANPPMALPAAPVASAPTPAPIAVPKPGQTTVPMIAPPAAPPTPPTTAPVTLPVPYLTFQKCFYAKIFKTHSDEFYFRWSEKSVIEIEK